MFLIFMRRRHHNFWTFFKAGLFYVIYDVLKKILAFFNNKSFDAAFQTRNGVELFFLHFKNGTHDSATEFSLENFILDNLFRLPVYPKSG